MFDELIIPAARLLDTVETKLKDVRLKNVTNRIEENTVAKQAITTILPPTIISNKQEQKKDGISIHLIRGDKPLEQESEEDKATREEARKATAEALKAIGQAAEKAGTDQDAQ